MESHLKKMEQKKNCSWKEWNSYKKKQTRSNELFNMKQMRETIIASIIQNVSNRFATDKSRIDIINPFIAFESDANLKQVHEMFGLDLALSSLSLQYNELVELKSELRLGGNLLGTISSLIQKNEARSNFADVLTLLCRIQICTPHSADVERCISSNNLLKTPSRSRMCIDTENKYLYIYFNMPALQSWDPRPAIAVHLNEKNRRQRVATEKTTQANYYKGVFDKIPKNDNDEEDEKDEDYEPIIKKRKF